MVDDSSVCQSNIAEQMKTALSSHPIPDTLFIPKSQYEWLVSQARLDNESFIEETEEEELANNG